MNIFLWVLQILLALHTAMGAVWKFSNAEQTVPSLNAIPHSAWLAMGVLELFLSLCLVVPLLYKPLGYLVPIAAVVIALEMLLFCVLHLSSGAASYSSVIYWLVVAAICAFIAYGRLILNPIAPGLAS
ncbi:DoxX family protein [Microbulbifer hainanensis]|uniref:DoxX family protein n=1 Tax=Microbulbifer hainanensis TaxID=2735675 RepID=UPI00186902A4|nr:DoxX family protein [Microbulbifer hainanensis]